jgi:hypothetical protein
LEDEISGEAQASDQLCSRRLKDSERIVEQGTPAELLARSGHYARMHAPQFEEKAGSAASV